MHSSCRQDKDHAYPSASEMAPKHRNRPDPTRYFMSDVGDSRRQASATQGRPLIYFRDGANASRASQAGRACLERRLIRCTVPGSTPNCLAMTRTPALPGVARASRIRFSSAGQSGGARVAYPRSWPARKAGTDSFLNHRPLELGKRAHHLKHRLPSGGRGVEPLLAQE
jgi:hypothetical protein